MPIWHDSHYPFQEMSYVDFLWVDYYGTSWKPNSINLLGVYYICQYPCLRDDSDKVPDPGVLFILKYFHWHLNDSWYLVAIVMTNGVKSDKVHIAQKCARGRLEWWVQAYAELCFWKLLFAVRSPLQFASVTSGSWYFDQYQREGDYFPVGKQIFCLIALVSVVFTSAWCQHWGSLGIFVKIPVYQFDCPIFVFGIVTPQICNKWELSNPIENRMMNNWIPLKHGSSAIKSVPLFLDTFCCTALVWYSNCYKLSTVTTCQAIWIDTKVFSHESTSIGHKKVNYFPE